jgi:hypothetical protein
MLLRKLRPTRRLVDFRNLTLRTYISTTTAYLEKHDDYISLFYFPNLLQWVSHFACDSIRATFQVMLRVNSFCRY